MTTPNPFPPLPDLSGYQNVRCGYLLKGDLVIWDDGESELVSANDDRAEIVGTGECPALHGETHGARWGACRVYRKLPVAKQGLAPDGSVLDGDDEQAPSILTPGSVEAALNVLANDPKFIERNLKEIEARGKFWTDLMKDGPWQPEEVGAAKPTPNLAAEAIKLVLGDRNSSYGNPADDYAKTAKIWSGLLHAKLKEDITTEEAILMMVGLKLSREAFKHKDDNITDAHGYLLCLEWARTGKRPEA